MNVKPSGWFASNYKRCLMNPDLPTRFISSAFRQSSLPGLISMIGILFVTVSCATTESKKSDPALIQAIQAGDASQVETLLAQGVDPNMVDNLRHPAITLITDAPVAASIHATTSRGKARYIYKYKNHAAIVKLLVQYGAKINVQGANGWTPLLQAQDSEETELVEFLKQSGATQ